MSAGKTTDHNSVKLEVKAGDHDEHKDVPGLDEDHAGVKTDFKESHGITTAEADELRLKWGRNELPEKVRTMKTELIPPSPPIYCSNTIMLHIINQILTLSAFFY